MKRIFYLAATALMLPACSQEHQNLGSEPIRVNQIGYYPDQEKIAVIEDSAAVDEYTLTDIITHQVVWKGAATRSAASPWNGKVRHIVDFSKVTQPGQYLLQAGDYNCAILIAPHTLQQVAVASTKAFYLQRSGEVIDSVYAGIYARPLGHPDTCVVVHASAASKERPEGTIISSPGGWYDAGDYNKYIVNSGFSVGIMLQAYEIEPQGFTYSTNIPESSNDVPDMLDEVLVNLRWMLTMQDPNDGGVYHKLTTPNFEAFIKPTECQQTRYVVQKSTAATLDFCASMALAARVYADFPATADFAKQAGEAALKAWNWAKRNPKEFYRQHIMNQQYAPAVNTGTYGDEHVDDEFYWAATELYFLTGKAQYLNYARQNQDRAFELPSWGNVNGLATYEWLIQNHYGYSIEAQQIAQKQLPSLLTYCDSLLQRVPTSCFNSPFGARARDFHWGCTAEGGCMNITTLLMAHRYTNRDRYRTAALQCADYLLGRNATGYCFVTGLGSKPVMHPHHRLSASDGIEAPLPGFLSGGPNPGQQDISTCPYYTSKDPDESYVDNENSYASNEIAINWNASLVAAMGWLDAVMSR